MSDSESEHVFFDDFLDTNFASDSDYVPCKDTDTSDNSESEVETDNSSRNAPLQQARLDSRERTETHGLILVLQCIGYYVYAQYACLYSLESLWRTFFAALQRANSSACSICPAEDFAVESVGAIR